MNKKSVRGTRDLIPKKFIQQKQLFQAFRKVSENFGFIEYDLPVLEDFELFEKKSGQSLVNQTYNFKDKSDRKISLRPELTPQLGRIFLEKEKELNKPLKWYSIPRCFRYERPQKGRLREFFQYNADIVGTNNIQATVEIICLSIQILKELGLKKGDFYIRISSREILDLFLKNFKNKEKIYLIIDDKLKITEKEFEIRLKNLKLNKQEINWIKEFTNISDSLKNSLKKVKTLTNNFSESEKILNFFQKLFEGIKDYGLNDFVTLDFSIVRGLAYYKGIVFEAFDSKNELRSILGGGSYYFNKTPCIGFAIGDSVLIELMKEKKLLKEFEGVEYFLIMTKKTRKQGFELLKDLRKKNKKITYDYDFETKNITKQITKANKVKAKKVIILGEKEVQKKVYIEKDLTTGNEIYRKTK